MVPQKIILCITLLCVAPLIAHTIVIDPGHGGKFTGATSLSGIVEKSVALDVAVRLKKLLHKAGFVTVLTRTNDKELAPELLDDLQARIKIAEQAKADLFVSIHFNSTTEHRQGYELYVPWREKPDMASYNAAMHLHHALAHTITPQWAGTLGNLNKMDGGIRQAKFNVLTHCPCPAVLVELEYLSHEDGQKRIASQEFREQLARALFDGISAWKK